MAGGVAGAKSVANLSMISSLSYCCRCADVGDGMGMGADVVFIAVDMVGGREQVQPDVKGTEQVKI